MSDAAWTLLAALLPPPLPGGRPRTSDLRAVLNAIFYLLRTGCQWRLLPREFPAWGSVYHYFRTWKTQASGVRGFDAHKCVKGRKGHILVDTLGLPIACRVEPANISDRRAASLLLVD